MALSEGALLKHLQTALFTISKDVRLLTNRQLSRHLVSLWVTGNNSALSLLKRILVIVKNNYQRPLLVNFTFFNQFQPQGLLNTLDSNDEVPLNEEELLLVRNNLNIAQVTSISLVSIKLFLSSI